MNQIEKTVSEMSDKLPSWMTKYEKHAAAFELLDEMGPVWDKVEQMRTFRALQYVPFQSVPRPSLFTYKMGGGAIKVESVDTLPDTCYSNY